MYICDSPDRGNIEGFFWKSSVGWRSHTAVWRFAWHWTEFSQALEEKGRDVAGRQNHELLESWSYRKNFDFFFFDHLKYICWKRNLLKRWPQIVIPREAVCWHWEFASLLKKKFKLRNVIYLHNASDLYLVVCFFCECIFVCLFCPLFKECMKRDR